jgi:hypothetical protein
MASLPTPLVYTVLLGNFIGGRIPLENLQLKVNEVIDNGGHPLVESLKWKALVLLRLL